MTVKAQLTSKDIRLVDISRGTRVTALFMISLAMVAITANFYQADTIYLRASVLPVYIFFFILMYLSCILVEYLSLWCDREKRFHCCRMAVHCVALLLVTFEVGAFYISDHTAYSQLPSYSLTSVLSNIVTIPSGLDNSRI